MDLDRLQGAAVAAVQKNVEIFEKNRRRETERLEAIARLEGAMQDREEVFMGLASFTASNLLANLDHVDQLSSVSIPVGRVSVPTSSDGETVERNLHAVVRNTYDASHILGENNNPVEDLETVAPKEVNVIFFFEAEEGDFDRGLLSSQGGDGMSIMNADGELIHGEVVAGEIYDSEIAYTEDGENVPSRNTRFCSKESADREFFVVNDELVTMRDTLELLQAGIQQGQPAVTQ